MICSSLLAARGAEAQAADAAEAAEAAEVGADLAAKAMFSVSHGLNHGFNQPVFFFFLRDDWTWVEHRLEMG